MRAANTSHRTSNCTRVNIAMEITLVWPRCPVPSACGVRCPIGSRSHLQCLAVLARLRLYLRVSNVSERHRRRRAGVAASKLSEAKRRDEDVAGIASGAAAPPSFATPRGELADGAPGCAAVLDDWVGGRALTGMPGV